MQIKDTHSHIEHVVRACKGNNNQPKATFSHSYSITSTKPWPSQRSPGG